MTDDYVDDTPRIYITDDNKLVALIQKAFELSRPQGMGFLHHDPQHKLSVDEARGIIYSRAGYYISLDYMSGRAVKLHISYDRDKCRYFLRDDGRWFDHSQAAWEELKLVLLEE